MSLALAATATIDVRQEQLDRDTRFIAALEFLLAESGSTLTAAELVELSDGPEGLLRGDTFGRLLRAGVPNQTAEHVTRTISAAFKNRGAVLAARSYLRRRCAGAHHGSTSQTANHIGR